MAQPTVLQEQFTRMIQDVPRDELPTDAAWFMGDWIPHLGEDSRGGRLAKRGGWTYASERLDTALTSASKVNCMAYFTAFDRFCVMTTNNKFGYFSIPGDSMTVTSVSSSGVQSNQNPVEFNKKLIIPANSAVVPKVYDGTTLADLGGSPPAAGYAAVWKSRLILANTAANPNRLFFSAANNPASWDTTNSYLDVINEITGLAVLPNSVLVFGSETTARIRGSIPPPGSPDMALDDPIFNTGCTYPRSIAVSGPNCYFANAQGVYRTNGTSLPVDITAICGIKKYWRSRVATSTVDVSSGFFRNFYVAVTNDSSQDSGIAFIFNVQDYSCYLFTNIRADCVAPSPEVSDELYFATTDISGSSTIPYVAQLSPSFAPSEHTPDQDGSMIQPILQTRFYGEDKSFKKRWKTLYLDYKMEDPTGDNPILALSYVGEGDETIETGISSDLAATAVNPGLPSPGGVQTIRAKRPLRIAQRQFALTISQNGSSRSTVLDCILADVHAREGGRV